MKKEQREYAFMRVNEVADKKKKEVRAKYVTPAKRLTPEERAEALRNGEFKVKDTLKRVCSYAPLADAFIFTAETEEVVHDQEALDEAIKAVDTEARMIMDTLMLGGDALKLLEEFSK